MAQLKRTVISLDPDDKNWLDEQARAEGLTMTELVRRAVRLLRGRIERDQPGLESLLDQTSGVWTGPDGLEYQRAVREE